MGSFLTRLFGPREPVPPAEVKALPGDTTGVTFIGSGLGLERLHLLALSGGTAPDAERLTRDIAFATSAYCYSAMLWRASRVAEPPLMVVRETEDGEEWLPRDPRTALLAAPRPDVDMEELLVRTQLYRDASGGALWHITRDRGGMPRRLTPFSAEEFRVKRAPALVDGIPETLIYGAYEVLTDGRWAPVLREDVVHFREPNPSGWYTGTSRLDVALALLGLGHDVTRIVRNFVRQAIFPGGVVSPDPAWQPTPEEWEAWKATVAGWAAGPAAAGSLLQVLGGTTITDNRPSLSDLLPADILNRVEATVGSVFGVPPVVLGWQVGLENSPWSQMSEARRQTYEDTIEPLWRNIERRLATALLSPEETAAGLLIRFDTRQVRALRDDEERQARIAALNGDIWTVNERRLATGQEPLPPEDPRGDVIGPLFQSGFGGLSGPETDPDPDPDPEDPEPEDEAEDPEDDEEDDPEEDPEEEDEGKSNGMVWAGFDLSTKAAEPAWERAVYTYLQGELSQILAAVKAAGGNLTDAAVMERVTQILRDNRPRLVAKLSPLIHRTGKTATARLGARLGLSFTVLEPGLLAFVREEGAFLAKVMGESTGRAVAEAVRAGLAEGETVRDLSKRLQELPSFDRGRARMVARTETTRAWNGAQKRSLSDFQRESGRTVTKEWLSAQDDRVRDEHIALDGEQVAVDGRFSNGLEYPGEPNCRCTLLYHVAGETAPVQEGQG